MPIHVLQLGPFPPPEGGVSRNLIAIRERLISRGDKCSVVVVSKSNEIREESGVYHPRSKFDLLNLMRSIDFDVMHLHIGGTLDRAMLGLAFVVGMIAGKKSVLTIHSGAFPLTPEAIAARPASIRGAIFRRFGAVFAVNSDIADVFRRFGVEDDRINTILPFSLKAPDPSVEIPPEIERFFAAHSPLLLAVGGLEPDYDPPLQVAAMTKIVERLPNAGLMIVGSGSMKVEVEAAVAASPVSSNILMTGNLDHPITLNLLSRADVLLRTTLFDGDAISIREALFLGTPVIATDNGLRPEGVDLMPVGDENRLVELVLEIADRPRHRDVAAKDDFSNIDRVIDIYRQLI